MCIRQPLSAGDGHLHPGGAGFERGGGRSLRGLLGAMIRTQAEVLRMIQAIGPALPNIPWEDRPPGCSDVVWRYSRNPIITRDAVPGANSIFNSAVVPFNGAFAGVFRCDNTARDMQIHAGFSDDGIHWQIEPQRIQLSARTQRSGNSSTVMTRASAG